MVENTLTLLENWFKEPATDNERSKLLSKIALIELCGWIEAEFDDLILKAQNVVLKDEAWVRINVLNCTFGFHYAKHFRPMLTEIIGEVFVRRVENEMTSKHGAQFDGLKSSLGTLWDKRCDLAHGYMAVPGRMLTVDSPAWVKNQFLRIRKSLTLYESVIGQVVATI